MGTLWRMVNLIGRRSRNAGLVCLEAEPGGRVERCLEALRLLESTGRLEGLREATEALESELEELALAPSRITALALLEDIDGLRRDAAALASDDSRIDSSSGALLARGDYVGYRPGRSLSTGEAEISSRGYFDVEDRPPIACWIGLLVPAVPEFSEAEDLVVAAWIPERALAHARAGCRACPNEALTLLSETAPEAHRQLREIESRLAFGK